MSPDEDAVVRHRLHAKFAGPSWLQPWLERHSGLDLDATGLHVHLGPWSVSTPLANLAGAEVSGPFKPWRALGVRLSLADCGLTFGTNSARGLCVRFRDPVPGIEPSGLLRHPSLTATIAEPDLVADVLNQAIGA
ncbi:hypothetical protein [Amycolatopsis sp. WQ 127309]|uniref:hypothetical protein n=1 Tax=Amycolatopsis sp. WQ 127309 TaxID=2932773 RepID=UPI001FF4938B|nr:hypothetical protein [Amycolatopsis sp. WQ 127309]UOZ02862.1 hypothetical protein MUY22_28790 [Amycolatopsis sp. WQ 127309]